MLQNSNFRCLEWSSRQLPTMAFFKTSLSLVQPLETSIELIVQRFEGKGRETTPFKNGGVCAHLAFPCSAACSASLSSVF